MKELEPFRDYELSKTLDQLFEWRLKIQDAKTWLNKLQTELDVELIERMKAQNVEKFKVGIEDNQSEISFGKTAKHTINVKEMKVALASEDDGTKNMAFAALGNNQSAWSSSKVREMQDTLGRDDLCKTTFEDKIKVKVKPVDILKQMGREQCPNKFMVQ